MNSSSKPLLLKKFRVAFSEIDNILRTPVSPLSPLNISEISELANVTLMLNALLRRYGDILDDTEKEILQRRIDLGIDKLLKLNQSHILSLYYFGRDFSKNPWRAEYRVRHFMTSVRALFELAPISEIPLDSTIWNYFIRDISQFVKQLVATLENSKDEIQGRLSFLLLIAIHSLISILKTLSNTAKTPKIIELAQKAEESLQELTKCLLNLFKTGVLKNVLDTSPGFVIYLHRVLKEDLTRFDGDVLSELESVVNKKLKVLDFSRISERSKNFYILNALELGQKPPKGIVPSGNDALAFLAECFIRFENGETFIGALPIQKDLHILIQKLANNMATKRDIEKIERLIIGWQENFQQMLKQNMDDIIKKLQVEGRVGKNKINRIWEMLDKIATISDTIEFAQHITRLFVFLSQSNVMSVILPLILKMF